MQKGMTKPNVYVTRLIPEVALQKLAESCDYRVWDGELAVPRDVLLREVLRIDGLLSLLTDKVDAGIMDAAVTLRVISNMAVDNIDVREATKRRIMVCNTPRGCSPRQQQTSRLPCSSPPPAESLKVK
jgi:glyoxylate reductase